MIIKYIYFYIIHVIMDTQYNIMHEFLYGKLL
jgi:hypothetical protein